MAQIITIDSGGSINDVLSAMFGYRDNTVLESLRTYGAETYKRLASMGSQIASRAKEFVESKIHNKIDAIKNTLTRASHVPMDDVIYEVTTVNVGMTMRSYMLAHPELAYLYINNRIEGWNDIVSFDRSYKRKQDMYYREEYLQGIDGVLETHEDHSIYKTVTGTEKELSVFERVDIYNTWVRAIDIITSGEDPTKSE